MFFLEIEKCMIFLRSCVVSVYFLFFPNSPLVDFLLVSRLRVWDEAQSVNRPVGQPAQSINGLLLLLLQEELSVSMDL